MLKTITKETYISISLAVMIFGYVVRSEIALSTHSYQLKHHHDQANFRIDLLEKKIIAYEERFMSRDETLLRFNTITNTLNEIKEKLK